MTNYSTSQTTVTSVFWNGQLSSGTRFDSSIMAYEWARVQSEHEDIVATIVAVGQAGAVCYRDGENISLSEVVRVQNELLARAY